MDLSQALAHLDSFARPGHLTRRISDLENTLAGSLGRAANDFLHAESIDAAVLDAAVAVKQVAGQINVTIHALGILLALPHLIEPDEVIVSVSLGAGNTGKHFDLATDRRVAEFKFIAWRGGPEAIRQNSVFIDILQLLQDQTGRRRFMYLLNKEVPIRFLHGNRAISSILSKNASAEAAFRSLYGDRYSRVGEWYVREVRGNVEIVDLGDVLPSFAAKSLREATGT